MPTEELNKHALAIREKALGLNHPDVAAILGRLARLYREQGKYAEAVELRKREIAIREIAIEEKVHGPGHPDVANSLNGLAVLGTSQIC